MSNDSSSKRDSVEEIGTVFVLGGGGVRGVFHLGSLRVLYDEKIFPDWIIGCSAGALVGSLYAATLDMDYVEKVIMSIAPYSRSFRFLGLPNLYKGIRGEGFFSLETTQKFLQKKLPAKKFEDLQVPLSIVATNLNVGVLEEFSSGELIKPICASAAIPGFFQPVVINDTYYGDGCILDSVPVRVAKKKGAKLIIAFNVDNRINPKTKNLRNLLSRSFLIASANRTETFLDRADVVIDPTFREEPTVLASHKQVQYLYKEGKKAAQRVLPIIKEKISTLELMK